ncbi:hypothetical protein AZ22_2490 [Bordetella bronchiseptica 980-2]|uniref:Uncharacterized protein n=2 Tax=Bordetella TaxID=517 RepID=K0MFM8_BORPB|nr:hypothetical protein AL472_25445 [Bordetella bronchiseptica]KAK64792.1 hypothetical protein AZ22_2490 [Bordetella bronchiseptica 980-2]KCV53428.1 hypothetical protein L491_2361 [Bordetella bronchiseptica 3E44]KCV58987.1 hypothetical protein AZ14_2420 [Bordetella bronchiseptica 980]KDB64661.1 hypothetical protein AZ16_2348 [Bordetella bronchiseptica B18-5 (C3)]KDB85558.1 hypothetical protein AZ27_2330 [Bordetella bronchiseptica D756]KDB87281.1 hypothetical protein AZ17_2403 [Bordetella bron
MIIPGAVHVDLYDGMDKIPLDRLTAFLRNNLAIQTQGPGRDIP